MKIIAIILARGGSKGIPRKNIRNLNGIPLINYTIKQCFNAGIDNIFTSSDDNEILEIAENQGSKIIKRPKEISGDFSTSESGWIHAIDNIQNIDIDNDWIFAPQVTSPIREKFDIEKGIEIALSNKYDSIFSAVRFEDFFIWEKKNNKYFPINYDFNNRLRRQDIENFTYLENGSFYLFKGYGIRKFNNRLYGKIGICEMDKSKMFQIDSSEDIPIIESILSKLQIK